MLKVLRRVNTLRTLLIGIAIALVGVALLLLSGIGLMARHDALQSLVNQTGGLFVATGLFATLWDLAGKRAFADEIFAQTQLPFDIREAGIERVAMQYLEDVEWERMFNDVRELDIFLAYGRSWRHAQHTRLQQAARRPGNKIRVILPDPDDEQHISVLARRFNRSAETLKGDILEAIEEFAKLHWPGGADLTLYVRRGDWVFSCYRFDKRAVITLYSHSRERTDVPTFVVAHGSLAAFVHNELGAIMGESRQINLEEAKNRVVA